MLKYIIICTSIIALSAMDFGFAESPPNGVSKLQRQNSLNKAQNPGNGPRFASEELIYVDRIKRIAVEPGRSYTYAIVSSPLPIERYTATFSITAQRWPCPAGYRAGS